MARALKSFTLVSCPVLVVLQNFLKKYKKTLIQTGQSVVAFPSVETRKSECMKKADTEDPQKTVNNYSMHQVMDAEDLIQATSGAEEKGLMVHTLHQPIRSILEDL